MKDLIIIKDSGTLTPKFAGSGNAQAHNPYPYLVASDRRQAIANYLPMSPRPPHLFDKKI
jgi:hypothetical protein